MSKLLAVACALLVALLINIQPSGASSTGSNTNLQQALFSGGCFWKIQYVFSNVPGVVKTRAGYCGGQLAHPTYEQVCTDKTGHAETVQIEYDPRKTTYRNLLEIFFQHIDPTTVDRQGPDVGTQYRSVIFYKNDQQKQEAVNYVRQLNHSHKFSSPIVTAIEPAGPFYDAEEYHQDYFKKHGQVCF